MKSSKFVSHKARVFRRVQFKERLTVKFIEPKFIREKFEAILSLLFLFWSVNFYHGNHLFAIFLKLISLKNQFYKKYCLKLGFSTWNGVLDIGNKTFLCASGLCSSGGPFVRFCSLVFLKFCTKIETLKWKKKSQMQVFQKISCLLQNGPKMEFFLLFMNLFHYFLLELSERHCSFLFSCTNPI